MDLSILVLPIDQTTQFITPILHSYTYSDPKEVLVREYEICGNLNENTYFKITYSVYHKAVM